MRYTKFEIRNYKGIQGSLILDLNKKPSLNIFTLVGLNESGKSSILEAINLLQNRIPEERAHEIIHKGDKGNFNGNVSIFAFMDLDEDDEKRIKAYCLKELDFKITKNITSIKIEKKYIFKNSAYGDYKSIWTLPLIGKEGKSKREEDLYTKNRDNWKRVVAFIENNFPKILYYKDFLFNFPQKIYLEEYQNESTEQGEYRQVIQDILDSFNDGLTINDHLLNRLKTPSTQHNEALEALLGKMGQKLTQVIFGSWEHIFSNSKNNKEIEIQCKNDSNGYYIEIKIRQGSDKYYINERSLGFRWFFSFLLFTEFRKARQTDFGETLFLLDEPANNLHQNAQQKLLSLFESIAEKSKIIYSTHSHHLVNPKYLAGTYIVRNHAIDYQNEENFINSKTNVKAELYKNFVSTYPNEEDHFKPILDALDYSPSRLENTVDIVCLEGKNDYYALGFFQDVVFKHKKYKLNFYPGASVDKFDQPFRLYTAWNKNFIALFDSDKQAKDAKKRYVKEISEELENKIFLLSDINTTFDNKTMEDLFEIDDKIKIIKSCFPDETKYNKSKFNTALQDIFINKKTIELSKATIENFEILFNFLSSKIKDKTKTSNK